jgi:hypothetical protein
MTYLRHSVCNPWLCMGYLRLGQTEEELRLMLDAENRARSEALVRFRRACEGVRMLRTLEREQRGPIEQWWFLKRRIEELPGIFARKREIAERARRREITIDEAAAQTAALMRSHHFPPGYVLGSEDAELARARCAFEEFDYHLWWGPRVRKHLGPTACIDLRRRFCSVLDRLTAVKRDAAQKEGQIEYQRWRLGRLRCDNWPRDVRPPSEHARWCTEITGRITTFQAELSRLNEKLRDLRTELNTLGQEYLAGCIGYPSCSDR